MEREKHFMIDIEATGVDFASDEILEIGILELDFVESYWKPGREFHTFVKSDRHPESEFAKEHMVEVYKKANEALTNDPEVIRDEILSFFVDCGVSGEKVLFTGWNAANFDVQFMHHAKFLRPSKYVTRDGKDYFVGDHHYRIYEMCGAIQLASDVLVRPYQKFKEEIKEAYEMQLPEGKQHDALYDCYMQTKMLNGLIKVMRK